MGLPQQQNSFCEMSHVFLCVVYSTWVVVAVALAQSCRVFFLRLGFACGTGFSPFGFVWSCTILDKGWGFGVSVVEFTGWRAPAHNIFPLVFGLLASSATVVDQFANFAQSRKVMVE